VRRVKRCMTLSQAIARGAFRRPAIRDFAGELILPTDAAFEEARRVENDAIDRRPAMIARCTTAADVASALRYARAAGLPVTVRAGGHGRDGFAVADEALVLDLRPMRHVAVDLARHRARVQGGATWRDLDAATGAHGLAVTGARLPSVGVAGFTLGSGSGWLERKCGLAADSLRSARVVTAGGDVVTASPYEHPDLFWALRGGGPSFGIVVELEFALYPVDTVVGGMIAWPAHRAIEVAFAYEALMRHAPDDLGGGLALSAALLDGPTVAVVVLWTGAADQVDAALAPLRALRPTFDDVRQMPYATLQGLFESPERYTARMHGEGAILTGMPPEFMAVLAEHQARKPVPLGSLLLQPMGGAFARMPEGDTPLGQRDAKWMLQVGAAWFDSAQDDAALQWAAGLREAIAPWSRGVPYPNFLPTVDPERLRASYGPEVWRRLQSIRATWDPNDVFSAGQAVTLPG
jgi:FAD/FMN-containing dehydrogenase